MTKLVWKRSSTGNALLSFWGLKVVVFPSRSGYNFNVLGLDSGVGWGPGFSSEKDARAAAEVAFLEHKGARDWETPGREAFEKRLDAERAERTAPPVTSRHQIDQTYFNGHYAHLEARAIAQRRKHNTSMGASSRLRAAIVRRVLGPRFLGAAQQVVFR